MPPHSEGAEESGPIHADAALVEPLPEGFATCSALILRVLADASDGVLRVPTGEAAVSFIDTRDIAAVAVESLFGDHAGREYALTGSESLTFAEVVKSCQHTRVPVLGYESIPDTDFRRATLGLGWHPDYVETRSGLFATIAAGYASPVTDDVTEVTGRRPCTLAEFLQEGGQS